MHFSGPIAARNKIPTAGESLHLCLSWGMTYHGPNVYQNFRIIHKCRKYDKSNKTPDKKYNFCYFSGSVADKDTIPKPPESLHM